MARRRIDNDRRYDLKDSDTWAQAFAGGVIYIGLVILAMVAMFWIFAANPPT